MISTSFYYVDPIVFNKTAPGTSFHFLDPIEFTEPGLGSPFRFIEPVAVTGVPGASFHFDSPGYQKVGSYVRIKDLDVDAPFQIFSITVAELPNPLGLFGHIVFVTDEAGGPVLAFSDNLEWRRWTDRAIVS